MKPNETINVVITGITKYGLFVKYNNYDGLVHISEISDRYVKNISELFSIGEEIDVKILEINEAKKQLILSYKKALLINPKIIDEIDIKIGFRSLSEALPNWVNEKTKNNEKTK